MALKVTDFTNEMYLNDFKCDEFLNQNFEIVDRNPQMFHFFWDGSKIPFGPKHKASIYTFLKTQPDNYTAKIWVDTIPNIDFGSRVKFEIYDGIRLARGTPIANCINILIRDPLDATCWVHSDIARLLILYKHGGIYIDFDNLFQRDMSPLMHIKEFAYCWPRRSQAVCNAIIKAEQGSKFIYECLCRIRTIVESGTKRNNNFAGQPLLSEQYVANPYNLNVLPTGVFHPEFASCNMLPATVNEPGFREPTLTFFKKNPKSANIFKYAFTWHWHNKWNQDVEAGSKFDLICKSAGVYIHKNNMTPNFIIGTGTGRSGTVTFTHLLGIQDNTISSHEFGVYDKASDKMSMCGCVDIRNSGSYHLLRGRFLKFDAEFIVETAFYWLHYAEPAIKEFNAKVVYLRRPADEVAASFEKKTPLSNHWQTHDGTKYKRHPFDVAFKKFDDAPNRYEAIKLYCEDCLSIANNLVEKYPSNVRIFDMYDLSDETKTIELLKWCGYKNPIFKELQLNRT